MLAYHLFPLKKIRNFKNEGQIFKLKRIMILLVERINCHLLAQLGVVEVVLQLLEELALTPAVHQPVEWQQTVATQLALSL